MQTPEDTGRPPSREVCNPAHASPRVARDGGRESPGDRRDNVDSPSALPGPSPGQDDAEAKTKQAGDPEPCGPQTATSGTQAALQLLLPGRNTDCHGTEALKQNKAKIISKTKTLAELQESARIQREEQRKMEVKLREEQKKKNEKKKTEQRQREIELREQHKRQKGQHTSQIVHVSSVAGPVQQQLATRGRGEGEAIGVGEAIGDSDGRKGGEAGGGDRRESKGLGIDQSKAAGGKHPGEGDNGGGGGGGSATTGSGVQKTVSFQHT